MKGDAGVIQTLNDILVSELTAINQYFLAGKIARHRGYHRLAERLNAESLEEMKHASRLIDRILYLEGLPNLQKLEKVRIAGSVVEQLQVDCNLERKSVERLNSGARQAREKRDAGTADLLEELVGGAERHVEWLEAQLGLVEELGEKNYLAQQL
jgi:bacterioferritin